jgi:hypothetical protein
MGNGGQSWSAPRFIVGLEDSSGNDFPLNVDGTSTLTGYQVRVWGAGNIVASPIDGTLYLAFMDNRAGKHDTNHPVTDANVFLMRSTDGGAHWQGPKAATTKPTDQWFPWVDVNPRNGDIGVVYHDRTFDGPYQTSFEWGTWGNLQHRIVSSEASHPRNSLFFRAAVEGCWKCATFHGDYNNVDFGSDGRANIVWTDMRRFINIGETRGYTENIFYARL